MAGVRKLRTQTEAYWRDEFQIEDEDLDLVTGAILDAGEPQTLSSLASSIMLRRVQREREAIARQASSGEVYRPRDRHAVGEVLVFSAQGFARGQVVGKRDGHNPKYGDFEVLQVALEDGTEREYASGLDILHPLNRPVEELIGGGDPEITDADIIDAYDAYVCGALQMALEGREEFVQFDGHWFLRELLPEVNVGHLNLAEAAIDVAGHPLTAEEIVKELELGTGTPAAQLFALNSAIAKDERFDNVGTADRAVWFLRALQPDALHNPPEFLFDGFRASGGAYIGLTMIDYVEEIGDELDDIESAIVSEQERYDLIVSFPHLYAGSMPVSLEVLAGLHIGDLPYLAVDLVDEEDEERFLGWVVPERACIVGLGEWYKKVGMVVGGRVSLRRLEEPATFAISAAEARDLGSNWVRTCEIVDGELRLQLRPPRGLDIGVGIDADLFVDVPNPEEVAEFMARPEQRNMPLDELVHTAFNILAGLTGTGYVHAKTVYSVANLIRRTGAVPVFAELARQACFDPLGQGLWAYDQALDGRVYETPDEMRDRPLSERENVLKDQAVPYTGR